MTAAEESLMRAEKLLERLEKTRERLEATQDPDAAVDILAELADIAKQVEAELEHAGARRASSLEAHRELFDAYLESLPFADELGGLTDAMRYSLDGGGKRIRPVLCLATGEAIGRGPRAPSRSGGGRARAHVRHGPRRPASARRRRPPAGRPTSHVVFGEATAILNGDALLARRSSSRSRTRPRPSRVSSPTPRSA